METDNNVCRLARLPVCRRRGAAGGRRPDGQGGSRSEQVMQSLMKRIAVAATFCLWLGGCTYPFTADNGVLNGIVYARYKIPLSQKLTNTPNELVIHADGKVIRIKEPITGYGIYAEFDTNAIGAIAKAHGIQTVYYADHEIFNVLGIWRRDRVIVHGR
jgi:hypothetical protein